MSLSQTHTTPLRPNEPHDSLTKLVSSANNDFREAGLLFDHAMLTRFVASLLTKRFTILTGLSGSGKTKLAQAFAAWITLPSRKPVTWPTIGSIIPSERISYHVENADDISILFTNGQDASRYIKVALPRELIYEWADYISKHNLPRNTPVREIRNAIDRTTRYSPQLNSFETHLKAAAFDYLNNAPEVSSIDSSCYAVVAVGADWNSNEHILGYPDALDPSRYIRTPSLDLILRAIANPTVPYFLILDEMNLSHVERYFADFLSAIESGEEIHLYSESDPERKRDGVPQSIRLPSNLFTIGTVNIDETTYMFSPKVLDRANTLEFRVSRNALEWHLERPRSVDLSGVHGRGVRFAHAFLASGRARQGDVIAPAARARVNAELLLFFEVMAEHGYEFGFRIVHEVSRFVEKYAEIEVDWSEKDAIDAQICQKLLPRLNGSRARLEPVLLALSYLCAAPRQWDEVDSRLPILANSAQLMDEAMAASGQGVAALASIAPKDDALIVYPLAYEKIRRMLRLLRQNGFTSFAEA